METKTQNTKQQAPKKNGSLLGRYFHSIEKERLSWQGIIVGNPEPGWYLVQLFSWLDGSPNVQLLVKFESMHDWLFYDDSEMMQFSCNHGYARKLMPK
jgi:hypothetical protein